MIGINSTFNNSFVNLNIKNNNNSSLNSNTNVKNLQDTKQYSKTSNKVLGYEVDKDGFFTSEFNKAAGIPEDIKIHSSTMESLVKISTNEKNPFRAFESIDIAKTIGNAYKILSQVVGEDVLNSKDSFSLEEIANFPQGYEFNRQSMQVTKIYNSATDYLNGDLDFDYKNTTDTKINKLFFNTTENLMKGNPAIDIFNNNNGGKENINTGVFFDTTPSKYTNEDGTITKGGLLVAIINENIYTREGEATRQGKTEGFDKSMSGEEVKKAWNDRNYNLKLNPNNIVQGAGIVDTNDENIEFTPLIEIMEKEQKELIKYLQKKQKIDITI
ncbi:Cj0814 family flagellar-dependent secreted protein [Campylobacter coli]